jgi:hypothetical protein
VAEIYEPLEYAENGKGTGKYRLTVRSDEDDHEPIGLCQHLHDTREEASNCTASLVGASKRVRWPRGACRALDSDGQPYGPVEDVYDAIDAVIAVADAVREGG